MRWRAYLLFGFMVATAAVLMMNPPYVGDVPLPADVAARRTVGAARITALHRHRSLAALERLGGRLHDNVPDGGGFFMGPPPQGMVVVDGEQVRDAVRQVMASSRSETGPVRVGLWVVRRYQADDGLPAVPGKPDLIMAGLRDGVPYCLRTVSASRRQVGLSGMYQGFPAAVEALGLCGWVARLGLPGPEIAEWLNATGATAGGPALRPDDVVVTLTQWNRTGTPLQRACLDGDRTACGAALHASWQPHPDLSDEEGRTPFLLLAADALERVAEPANELLDRWVLADLDAEFGTAALRAFWTSNLEPDAAFREAFGADPGDWFYQRLVGNGPAPFQRGPRPSEGDLVVVLAVAGAGLWFGSGFARRRRVDG